MELHDQIREALELQAIEADGEGAAKIIQAAIMEHTAVAVGDTASAGPPSRVTGRPA